MPTKTKFDNPENIKTLNDAGYALMSVSKFVKNPRDTASLQRALEILFAVQKVVVETAKSAEEMQKETLAFYKKYPHLAPDGGAVKHALEEEQ